MDKAIIAIILTMIALAVGFFIWQYNFQPQTNATSLPQGIIYFYGITCSHCKDVDRFIEDNKIDEKIKITHLEVFDNQNNAALALKVAQECKLSLGLQVPLLYDPSSGETGDSDKCYVGAVDVINFLKNVAEIQ